MKIDGLQKIYQDRVELFELKLSGLRRNLALLSFLRFFTFILAITLIVFLIKQFSLIILGLSFFFFAFFIFGVVYYLKKTEVLYHIKNLIKINKDEINVLTNNFSGFNDGVNYISRDHAYSFDLDLFGGGSLFQYLNRTVTLVGRELLAKRLLNINNVNGNFLEKRQDAISELTPKIEWRHNFMATGYSCPVTDDDNKKIQYWIDEPVYFIKRILFKILVVLLPVITLSFLALLIAGISHYSWFVLFALLQLLTASILLKRTNKEQRIVSEEIRILKNYSKLIKLIENETFNSEILKKLQNDLKTETVQAEIAFKKLIRIIDAFDTRLNIFLGLILNSTLMWDLYSLMRLERWKVKYGQNIKQWVQVIAEFDIYCSMANYSFNNQGFVYPQVSGQTVLDSEELGHPLIPISNRVNNNFKIDKSGEIDIITGANMAGKSTFLRTVGVNLILAMNGMPVCAKKFHFRLMDLYSGMRTADSLKENESYFYAELKRLKHLVEKLKQGKTTFVLLDEILKGTNSIDKAEGSWKFVEHLIKLKATGIVATHDLTLCKLEKDYSENIKNKCFEVEINADKILFDYKLRPGITQNMNASILMRQMGIFSN
jgi:DNA mismatch repair ATPase MutS